MQGLKGYFTLFFFSEISSPENQRLKFLSGHEPYYTVKTGNWSRFFGHSEQFFSLQYSKIVTGGTALEGGLLDPGEEGRNLSGNSLIRPAEGLEIPRLLFRTWSNLTIFPVLNTTLGVGVPKNGVPESDVPFAEGPALVFSFEDLAPAFQEPALQSPLF